MKPQTFEDVRTPLLSMSIGARFALALTAIATLLVLSSCSQLIEPVAEAELGDEGDVWGEPVAGIDPTTSFLLLGDPSFDVAALEEEQLLWFERALVALESSSAEMVAEAERDDIYAYGRSMFQFSTAALLGLRATGYLGFLDALDPMMQALRGQLSDSWCANVEESAYVNATYGTVTSPDGFRNFRYRRDRGLHYCRDVGDLNETLTHGHLAMVMYAYHANRDLTSPAGIDYGERADFWFDYLRNDFEAKWRSRSGVTWPAMDFINLRFSHTYHVFLLYYYFMGKRLESESDPDATAYMAMVTSLTNAMFEEPYMPGERGGGFVEVTGPTGDAVVYSFGSPGWGPVSQTLLAASPMTYTRYMMSAILTLWAEGVPRWNDEIMTRLTNGLTSFVIDIPQVSSRHDTIAAGVTGEETIGGIPPTTYRPRLTITAYGVTSTPAYAIWDTTSTIKIFSLQAYQAIETNPNQPSQPHIPASMLFATSTTTQEPPADAR